MSDNGSNAWFEKPLGQLAEPRRGITYSSAMLDGVEDGMPYVNMKSFLKGGGFNHEGIKRYAGVYTQQDIVGERDLLIANTDVTSGDIIGVPALLPKELMAHQALYSHHVTRLRISGDITLEFLYYLLCLPEYRSEMLRIARGTTVLMLDMPALKRIPIRAPKSEAEQNRITELLLKLDDAIDKTKSLIAKYQKIKAGLMHDLFTRGVTTDGKLRPPREQAPELYKETPIGWIPKEWETAPIESLCSDVVDCPHSTPTYESSGVPCIRTADMLPGQLLLNQAYRVSEKAYGERVSRLPPIKGDIIYSREGERLGIASPVGDEKVCLGQRVMLLRPESNTDLDFLLWTMNTFDFYRRVVSGLGATTSPHVNVGDIRKQLVVRPSPTEQNLIGCTLKVQHRALLQEENYRDKLLQSKYGLMHDLLTGRVRVSGASNVSANI